MPKTTKKSLKNKLHKISQIRVVKNWTNLEPNSFRKRENIRVLDSENFFEIPQCSHGI